MQPTPRQRYSPTRLKPGEAVHGVPTRRCRSWRYIASRPAGEALPHGSRSFSVPQSAIMLDGGRISRSSAAGCSSLACHGLGGMLRGRAQNAQTRSDRSASRVLWYHLMLKGIAHCGKWHCRSSAEATYSSLARISCRGGSGGVCACRSLALAAGVPAARHRRMGSACTVERRVVVD